MALANDPEYCIWCGRGPCRLPPSRRAGQLRRLPRDLGAFVREGRRPDPNLDNVVRLDRLRRDAWKVPPAPPSLSLVLAGEDWPDLRDLAA